MSLEEREDVGRMPFGMVAPTVFLVAASVAVTVLAGPLSIVSDRAAANVSDVAGYRAAVLGVRNADDQSGLPDPGRTLNPADDPSAGGDSVEREEER